MPVPRTSTRPACTARARFAPGFIQLLEPLGSAGPAAARARMMHLGGSHRAVAPRGCWGGGLQCPPDPFLPHKGFLSAVAAAGGTKCRPGDPPRSAGPAGSASPQQPHCGCMGVKRPGDSYDRPRGTAAPLPWDARSPKFFLGLPQGFSPRRLGSHAGEFALTGLRGKDRPAQWSRPTQPEGNEWQHSQGVGG